jgi:hypothetical protein
LKEGGGGTSHGDPTQAPAWAQLGKEEHSLVKRWVVCLSYRRGPKKWRRVDVCEDCAWVRPQRMGQAVRAPGRCVPGPRELQQRGSETCGLCASARGGVPRTSDEEVVVLDEGVRKGVGDKRAAG